MKPVLYLSYDGMTDPLGQSQVIPYLQGLTRKGYQFTILSFEKKERFDKDGSYIRSLLQEAGIKWEPQIFSRNPPILAKLYDLWKMHRVVFQLQKKEHFEFIHCRSYIAADAGLKLFKKYKTPFLFDMRGFWVDERVDNGQWNLKNPLHRFFYKTYKKKEKEYFDKASHIISLTWRGAKELETGYSVPADKITVIPCCVDLDHFDYQKINQEKIAGIKELLKIKSTDKVISYLGSLGGWYLLKEMFDFFLEMKTVYPEIKFLFITQNSPASVLEAAIQCGADANDIIIQPASRAQVPAYLSLSDWSIFFIKNAYSKKASSPTKQGEIMAMGIPIICNDVGDTGKIIESSQAGIVAHTFTKQEFKNIVVQLDSLKQVSKSHIRESAFQFFDLHKGVESYLSAYKKIKE